ncbi:MAG: NAD(P)H-binding protein [Phycisphaerales bacterium JB043]
MVHEASPEGSRTIAVTGSTGFVGRHVVRELLDRGFGVVALARDRQRASSTLPQHDSLSIVEGDVFQGEARDALLDGVDACVHLIGIRREIRSKGVTFQRLHVDATRLMVEAATSRGVRRFVHMSSLGTRDEARSSYHKTKHASEMLVRHSTLDWTILRPSVIHGEGSEFVRLTQSCVLGQAQPSFILPYFESSTKTMDMVRPGESQGIGRLQPVAASDVAWCVGACLETDATIGEIYPIGGPQAYTWPVMWEKIRDLTDGAKRSIKPWGVPAGVGIGLARLASGLGMGELLPFCESDVIMSTEDNSCSNAKAHAHFGFSPKGFEESFVSYQRG